MNLRPGLLFVAALLLSCCAATAWRAEAAVPVGAKKSPAQFAAEIKLVRIDSDGQTAFLAQPRVVSKADETARVQAGDPVGERYDIRIFTITGTTPPLYRTCTTIVVPDRQTGWETYDLPSAATSADEQASIEFQTKSGDTVRLEFTVGPASE